ncbi:aldo-keto reductase family 1 member A1, partial [Caerostris darwini]
MEPTNTNRSVLLSSGYTMPIVGLGMFLSKDENELDTAVTAALEIGYRHFDTAFSYANEVFLGRTLKRVFSEKRIARENLFITTKLPPNGLHPDNVEYFFRKSLEELQLEYIDLYLIHFPVAAKRTDDDYAIFPTTNGVFAGEDVDPLDTWKVLEDLVDKGLIRSIGLSNFNSEQVKRIYEAARIKPAVLQVECHAYLPQYELHDLCKELKIALTAYSPIGAPGQQRDKEYALISDPELKPLCEKYEKSPAQVLLRYLVQRGIIVIPKSTNPKRLAENIQDLGNHEIGVSSPDGT